MPIEAVLVPLFANIVIASMFALSFAIIVPAAARAHLKRMTKKACRRTQHSDISTIAAVN